MHLLLLLFQNASYAVFVLIEESLHTIMKYMQHKRLLPSEEIIFLQQE
jgi:hypothetical protein